MRHPAQGMGRDPSLPALGPIGTMGIDGKPSAAGRRRPVHAQYDGTSEAPA